MMTTLARICTAIVGLLHVAFGALEMVFWTKPLGQKVFGTDPEFASASATLALNQGLYNLFLAAGLFWAVMAARKDVGIFFLGCVIVAGVVGALTVSPTIFVVQAVPAIIARITLLAKR